MLYSYTTGSLDGSFMDMKRGPRTKNKGRKSIKIFPDSSWLIALLCDKDSHNAHVKSSFGLLYPQGPTFYFSTIVIMEAVAGLIKSGLTVKASVFKVFRFIQGIEDYKTQPQIGLKGVLEKYVIFSQKRSIKDLTTMDFYIVTEGILVGAKILTADKRMYQKTKKIYKDIYLISDQIKGVKSDLPRLAENVIHNLKA